MTKIRERLAGIAPLGWALAATAVGLLLGYLLKYQCVSHPWANNHQYSSLCYNDIQPLFGVRGISKGLIPYVDVQLEYPVLTGVFMDLVGRLLRLLTDIGLLGADSDGNYFILSALFLAPFALAVTLILRKRVTAGRLLIWAFGTPIILYAFHNWDLIAVAFAVWGMVAFERASSGEMGGALAAGASAKLYPAFMLPGALLHALAQRDLKRMKQMLLGFGGIYLILNLPWALIATGPPKVLSNPNWSALVGGVELRLPSSNGWLGVWTFHARRYPDFGTVWFWIAHHGRVLVPGVGWDPGQTGYRDFVSVASFLLFGAGALFFLYKGWQRRGEPRGYPVLAVSMGIIAAFLLTSKVNSPQYTLWLVPFMVMLDVPWRRVALYLAADLAVYVSGFYYFTVMNDPAPAWFGVFEAAVLMRAAAVVWLGLWALRARRVLPAPAPPG